MQHPGNDFNWLTQNRPDASLKFHNMKFPTNLMSSNSNANVFYC